MNRFLLLLLIALAGCTANADRGALLRDGTVRIEAIQSDTVDYRFNILSGYGMTYDFGKKEDRVRAVGDYLKEECSETEILKETSVNTGTYATGRPRTVYTLDVKCIKKAG